MRIGQDTINWNKSMKYLGVQFKSGHVLQTDNETVVQKFYAAANAICSHVKFASEMSVLSGASTPYKRWSKCTMEKVGGSVFAET